jgi:hypothetical protein
MLAAQIGCVWHGEFVDHLWGPAFFRVTTPPDSESFLAEQTWSPLLFEGGNRWGISVGYFRKMLILPLATHQINEEKLQFSWHSLFTIPIGSWKMSPIHTSIERVREAEFLVKRVVGFQLSGGFDREGSNFTIGTAYQTAFWPGPDAFYLLEFSSGNPTATRFRVCDAKKDESLELCLEEVFR